MPESPSLDQLRREHRRIAAEERALTKAIAARGAAESSALADQRAGFEARELALKKRVADLERRLHESLGNIDRRDKAFAALERRRKDEKEEASSAAAAAAEEREASAAREREREREAAAEAEKAKASAAAIKATQMQLESARLDADVQRAAHEAGARRAARAVAVARAEAADAKAAGAAAAAEAAAASAKIRDQVERAKRQHECATKALLAERDAEIGCLRQRLRALEEEALALAGDGA
jgi:hypothetical protein